MSFNGTIYLTKDQTKGVFDLFDSQDGLKFEDVVREQVGDQFPENISGEQLSCYIGALSTLLWCNKEYYSNLPDSGVGVYQKSGGDFKMVRRYF